MENSKKRFIQCLHRATNEQLGEMMRLRLLGNLGPGLETAQSWAELLADAYIAGNAQFQHALKNHLLALLYAYARPSRFQALNDADPTDWQTFSTALILASQMDWRKQAAQTQDLKGLLNAWLHSALEPLPKPRNIATEARRPGYPQIDLLSNLLLVARKLPLDWDTGLANKLWQSTEAETAQTALNQAAKAERLWELATWALNSNDEAAESLANHINALSQALETANWQPGNLTLLFLRAELGLNQALGADRGTRRIAQLICKVPVPEDITRRAKLAVQLDYFAEQSKAGK